MKTVEFEDKILTEVNIDESEFDHEVKLGAAMSFYMRHRLTLGQAAEMSGLTQYEFMRLLKSFGIASLNYPASELEQELIA
jgi:predicted HTH domain antitoxin